jgi:hypothetical protein
MKTSLGNDAMFDASAFSILLDDQDVLECFLIYPAVDVDHPFALDFDTIAQAQNEDATLLQSLASKPNFGRLQMSEDANLICYIPGPNQPFKVCIPDALLNDIIHFYHLALNHTGITCLHDTITLHFSHPHLQKWIKNVLRPCNACQ